MDVFVGRQPIFDRYHRTVAYELLFRSGMENRYSAIDGTGATTAVITNAFLNIGCKRVLGTKRGFINFTRPLLVDPEAWILPKERVVIEILEDVEPDAEIVAACRRLQEAGYSIALDDITAANASSPLLPFAEFAKLDWLVLDAEDRRRLSARFRRMGLRLLAEKVETKSDFDAALEHGCELFQGFYFARPEIIAATQVPTAKMACLRLLREIQQPELSYERLETLVRPDVGLAQKLLLFVNAAAFTHQSDIQTLRQAFFYLGENKIRKWVTLAALPNVATGKPAELVTASLIRARFCELAAENSRLSGRASSCFLVGLLSLLDAMVGRPLEELLEEMGLEANVADAILGRSKEDDGLRAVLNMAVAFERADFDAAAALAASVGLAAATAADLHIDAMAWADSLPR